LSFESGFLSPEVEWIQAHQNELAAYAGEWVVLQREGIVVRGKDYQRVRAAAVSLGIEIPFIIRVPEMQGAAFMGL
jgi:hypothetical protein